MDMRRSHSLESLPMLPEEARMAASLFRLTLSDKQETSTETEFQSYISKHSHFPYHKAFPVNIVHHNSGAQPVISSSVKQSAPVDISTSTQQPRRCRILQRRCDSTPSTSTCKEDKSASGLSRSAPTENQGFFQRLFPSFRRGKVAAEEKDTVSQAIVVKPVHQMERSATMATENTKAGHFVCQFTRTSRNNNMDNFIFMSMR